MKIYKVFAHIARFVYNIFIHYKIEGTIPKDVPSVFVVHHQNMSGPIHSLLTLPVQAHMWVFKAFFEREACFKQYKDYTFSKRFGMPMALAAPLGWIASLVVPAIVKSFSAIPVYRNTRNIVKTFSLSHEALLRDESLIVAPDIDYDSDASTIGEIYTGFFHLEKKYFEATNKHLAFVPIFYSVKDKKLLIGNDIRFDDNMPYNEQKKLVAEQIKDTINHIKENRAVEKSPDLAKQNI